jgi:hypothetical protein
MARPARGSVDDVTHEDVVASAVWRQYAVVVLDGTTYFVRPCVCGRDPVAILVEWMRTVPEWEREP